MELDSASFRDRDADGLNGATLGHVDRHVRAVNARHFLSTSSNRAEESSDGDENEQPAQQ